MTVTRHERAYYRAFGIDDLIRPHLFPGARVLDVGSSDGSGSAVLKELQVDAVDIHRPSLDAARAAGVRGRCIQADIMALPFADGSYDVVTALDVIEHLPKEGGLALLDELERVCRGQVVVLTPYGFMEQPPYPDQPWMEHKSGWWPRDFADRGYRTLGAGGVRFCRRHEEHTAFRWGPLGKAIGLASVPLTRRVPQAAFDLVAVKQVA